MPTESLSPPTAAEIDAYWSGALDELAALPPAPELQELPLRSTDEAACWGVRLTSIGPYRIFGYLSLPRGEGPFPAIYFAPRYQSVVEVLPQGDAREKRGRFVTFSLAARGQRNADRPYAASFPGLLTDGIEDPATYTFRGIIADALRGLTFLLDRPEVDRSRVAMVGSDDIALLAAALAGGLGRNVAAVATYADLFYAARQAVPRSHGYPLEEINDLLRARPEMRDQLYRTLDFFDPLHLAPRLRARALLWAEPDGDPHDREALQPLAAALAGSVEARPLTGSRYRDGLYQEEWISRALGFEEAIVTRIWK